MNIRITYAIIAVVLLALEQVYFKIADHYNIIDKPNARSSHTKVVLRGGGIIFLFGAWLWAAFFGLQYPWFMTGLTIIALVSFIDDIHSVRNRVRLFVQFITVSLLFYELGFADWKLWWLVLIAWIVCVGIINAYNFMDGINGITGGYSLAVLFPLIAINSLSDSGNAGFIDNNLLIVITLSTFVFCIFNFRKQAKCFSGDVGAVSMAFILIFAIGKLIMKTGDFSYIMFLAVYGVDTILTIIHRIKLHENLGEAHRKHAYQLMANELKIPHVIVSTFYMALQMVVSAGLIFLPMNHYLYSGIVLALLCCSYLLFMKKYYHLHAAYLASAIDKKD